MSLGRNVPGLDKNTVFICSLQVLRRKKERLCIVRVRVVFRFEAVITLIAGRNMFLEWF